MPNIDCLPDEVLEFILSYVSPYQDLESCKLTCQRWYNCSSNVLKKREADFGKCVPEMRLAWTRVGPRSPSSSTSQSTSDSTPPRPKNLEVGRRYSHCATYHPDSHSLYVFGGCTSSATTFNDLWRLDLTERKWHHVLTTGSYPSPKACSVLVLNGDKLILFGGWNCPSVWNHWKLFNELHEYDIINASWSKIPPSTNVKPPTMAGHSATIHNGQMIVFGGLQKQRNSIGQFSGSSDVWSFDLKSKEWTQKDIPEPRPKPRYGQSQLYLDDNHLLILGGCGGPSNKFNDVWLLKMEQPHWSWVQCRVENPHCGTHHMWCHPAVKVGDYAVMLDKNRLPKQQETRSPSKSGKKDGASSDDSGGSNNEYPEARWNVIPQLRRGVNRGYGAIRRPRRHSSQHDDEGVSQQVPQGSMSADEPQDSDDMDVDEPEIAVVPVDEGNQERPGTFRSSVQIHVNPTPGPSSRPPAPTPAAPVRQIHQLTPRLQAFAVSSPNSSAKTRQLETRQRQLEMLRRMEERYKTITAAAAAKDHETKERENHDPEIEENQASSTVTSTCACQRLTVHVLDISKAISDNVVTWLNVKSNSSLNAPEETILYTLTRGRGELIMFGGIQKDLSAMAARGGAAWGSQDTDTVSNSLHFLCPPGNVI